MPSPSLSLSTRSFGDLCVELLYAAIATPQAFFWIARAIFLASFGAFAITGIGFATAVSGPQTALPWVLAGLSMWWFFLPFFNAFRAAISSDDSSLRVRLGITDEHVSIDFPGLRAVSTRGLVRSRHFAGRLLVTVAGHTCALRGVDPSVAEQLIRPTPTPPTPEADHAFDEPLGALVSITSAPPAHDTIRGWLAMKPFWWALPLLLIAGAFVMWSLPDHRAGVAIPHVRLAVLSLVVAITSMGQDAAFGVVCALQGSTRRRARGYRLSITRHRIHARTAEEALDATFDTVTAVAAIPGGIAISLGGEVLVAFADEDTARRMLDIVREHIGDRSASFLA